MNKKIIVSGRPRSGTSLMMRILDVSGYNCVSNKKWGEKIGNTISNPYFYEDKNLAHKGNLTLLKNHDAGKIFIPSLNKIKNTENYFIIWMDRNKEAMFKSWDSYNRENFAKISNEEDYNRFDENLILSKFQHVKISFDLLVDDPLSELSKLKKYINIDVDKAILEINPNLKHY